MQKIERYWVTALSVSLIETDRLLFSFVIPSTIAPGLTIQLNQIVG